MEEEHMVFVFLETERADDHFLADEERNQCSGMPS